MTSSEMRICRADPVVRFKLPRPPSVNNLFATIPGRGRVMSESYRTWRKTALPEIMVQRIGQPKAPARYEMHCIYERPRTKRGAVRVLDLDNLIKPVSDVMVEMGIIWDDCLAERIILEWGDVEGCEVTISRFIPMEKLANSA